MPIGSICCWRVAAVTVYCIQSARNRFLEVAGVSEPKVVSADKLEK